MTVTDVIKELEKVEMVRKTDQIYHAEQPLSCIQEKIFMAFEMDRENVRERMERISELLTPERNEFFREANDKVCCL